MEEAYLKISNSSVPILFIIDFTEENDVAFCLAPQQTLFQLVHAG